MNDIPLHRKVIKIAMVLSQVPDLKDLVPVILSLHPQDFTQVQAELYRVGTLEVSGVKIVVDNQGLIPTGKMGVCLSGIEGKVAPIDEMWDVIHGKAMSRFYRVLHTED